MVDTHPVRKYIDQLLRGVVEPLMLFIISELPSHGYQIGKEIERRSSGYFRLTASTVYSSLRRLESEGLVRSAWATISGGPRRRYYYLTEKGREVLSARMHEWEEFSFATEQVLAHG